MIQTVLLYLLCTTLALSQVKADSNKSFSQLFMMEAFANGKKVEHSFEIWELSGVFLPTDKRIRPYCQLKVVTLSWLNNTSHLFSWIHKSITVTARGYGVYVVDMTGRMDPSARLEIFVRFDKNHSKVIDLTGSVLAVGPKEQTKYEFKIDRKSFSRTIPPVGNPSWQLKEE